MSSKLLFSEDQVNTIVEAKFAMKLAELKFMDEPPKTVRVVRSKMISLLEETEKEIVKKHDEAMMAWKKAYEIYGKFLSEHPGTQGVSSPGYKPAMPQQTEKIRAWVRALKCLENDDSVVTLTKEQWISLFLESVSAISEMQSKQNEYTNWCTGSAISLNTLVLTR